MIAEFEAKPSFDWRKVRVDFPEGQIALAGREDFSDDQAREEREENEKLEESIRASVRRWEAALRPPLL